MNDINELLRMMLERHASDMHLRANSPVSLRVSGKLEVVADEILSSEETARIAMSFMNEDQKKMFSARHEIDLSFTLEGVGRFRINIFNQRSNVNMALRHIPTEIPSIEDLNLPGIVKEIAENQRGLVLVTGTTGCGKSTTLASMIDFINSTRSANIITIEDPIEFIHRDKKSIVSQRELGFDTLSYPDALKNIVRQDPNVLLVGEMRDLDTMAAAITAAQTGHLVFSTVHTVDAAQSINRIVDMFPPHQQNQIRLMLADTLKAVISQRLLPSAKGQGRVPAVEILIVTQLIRKLIEEKNISEIVNQMKQGQYYGMQTFHQSLFSLIRAGQVKLEDALFAASNPEELMLAVRGIEPGSAGPSLIIER